MLTLTKASAPVIDSPGEGDGFDPIVLGQVRQLLRRLRRIDLALTSETGLRSTLQVLLQLAELVGVDEQWQGRVRSLLFDRPAQRIVLALLRYFLVKSGCHVAPGLWQVPMEDGQIQEMDATDAAHWLPQAIQLMPIVCLANGGELERDGA